MNEDVLRIFINPNVITCIKHPLCSLNIYDNVILIVYHIVYNTCQY